jgi:hypothetical protein
MPAALWHNRVIPEIMAQSAFENHGSELLVIAKILVRYVG